MTHSTTIAPSELDELCINTLRFLAVDMVQKASSGHPGLPLGSAAMAYTLWDRFLKVNPSDPRWPDRDRFVLSAGHGSALLYALLHVNKLTRDGWQSRYEAGANGWDRGKIQ